MKYMLLFFLPLVQSANIFVGPLLGGSHTTALYDLAVILGDAGHNVTFVNVFEGGLRKMKPHPNIHRLDFIKWEGEDKNLMWKMCVQPLIESGSTDIINMFTEDCISIWGTVFDRANEVYTSQEVLDLFTAVKFHAILGERVDNIGLAILGAVTDTPVISYAPSISIHDAINHNNLPMLVTSQVSIGFQGPYDRPPTFMERFNSIAFFRHFLPFFFRGAEATNPFLEKFGYADISEVAGSVRLFLTNDHPAFTFPFLRPPNEVPVGCATMLGSKDLPVEFPEPITSFLERSEGKKVVLVTFGTYAKLVGLGFLNTLMDILVELDLRIIIKSDSSSTVKFPESVLPMSWLPQKDLLRSGKVDMFISHCGNSGRLETIYYNVPVLCVPQFADQPMNSRVVELKGFGEMLLAEDIADRGRVVIRSMLENLDRYRENMKYASDIVDQEPGNVKERLLFHVDHLSRFGNMDYLVNQIIREQSMVEVYNLDILLLVLVGVVAVLVVGVWGLVRGCKVVCRKRKTIKEE